MQALSKDRVVFVIFDVNSRDVYYADLTILPSIINSPADLTHQRIEIFTPGTLFVMQALWI